MSSDVVKERAIELLGDGVPQVSVAAMLGVDDSYISQLLGDDQIREQVSELRAKRAGAYKHHDNEIDRLEDVALQKVGRLLQGESSLTKVAGVFRILNNAHRRSDGGQGAQQAPQTIVALNLPAAARVALQLTVDRQVIEIDGRSMVPMQAKNVQKLLQERQAQRLLEHSQASLTQDVSVISQRTKSIADSL